MKSILVYFTGFSRQIGGSEALVFLLLREMQARYDVTLALQHTWLDPFAAAEMYGLPLDRSRIKVVLLDKAPGLLAKMDRHLKFLWMRRLRKMGPRFDICISCANPVDFGRPGKHFVFMLSLDNAFKAFIWKEHPRGREWLRYRTLRFRDCLARMLAGARTAASVVRDGREVVLPNSCYAKRCIENYYHCKVHEAFYPPTLFEAGKRFSRVERVARAEGGSLSIVSLGRIGPEKRPLEMVEIVKNARNQSGLDFKLRLVGHCSNAYLKKRLAELTVDNPWLRVYDAVVGTAKAEMLASCSFALHACNVEAFGISITEYMKAGLVPIVPREGGSSEVVGLDSLVYENEEEAADILIRLATDNAFYNECLSHCTNRAKLFTADAYLRRQKDLFEELGL